jgi:hypothetical protein
VLGFCTFSKADAKVKSFMEKGNSLRSGF